MKRWLLVSLFWTGCGEIEQVDLQILPSTADFTQEIQPLLIQIGCSPEGACHDTGAGELTILQAAGAGALDTSYQSVKSKIDLETPAESRLMLAVLEENTKTQHRPVCIAQAGCAYQKLAAWIAWQKAGDLRPQDIMCDSAAEGCFK